MGVTLQKIKFELASACAFNTLNNFNLWLSHSQDVLPDLVSQTQDQMESQDYNPDLCVQEYPNGADRTIQR